MKERTGTVRQLFIARAACSKPIQLSTTEGQVKHTPMNASTPAEGPPPLPPGDGVTSSPIKPWRWWIHLLLIAAYPLLIGVVGVGGETRGPALASGSAGLLWVCAVQLAVFAGIFGLAWLASRASRDALLWRWRGGFWPVPLGIAYSVGIRVALGLVVVAMGAILIVTGLVSTESLRAFSLENRPDVESLVDVSAMKNDPLYYWLTLTLVSFVVAGLREEVWRGAFLAGMKGLWPQRFGSRRGQVVAVLLAAVIFGIAHIGQGILGACFAGLLGVGLGLIMVLHRSIWPAVIAHGMFDATSLALIPWAVEKLQEIQKSLGQ